MTDKFSLDQTVKSYAVFGNPVGHSKSPLIHSLFAKQTGLSFEYQAIEVPLNDFCIYLNTFRAEGGKGLNITVPFKGEAYCACTNLTERAERAGSVNTIWFDNDSNISGDTTDGQGLINDLFVNHGLTLKNKSLLVLGAGGSVNAILEPLLDQKPERLVVVNRTLAKATTLVEKFSYKGNLEACSYDALSGQSFDLIVNATSSSLKGELPPLPETLLNHGACCYDLMYSDTLTVFMDWGTKHGAALVTDGLGMLVEQAAESFQIWHGIKPETKSIIDMLRNKQIDSDVGC